jgi:hypothetical protein
MSFFAIQDNKCNSQTNQEAETVAKAIFSEWFCKFGILAQILKSLVANILAEVLSIKQKCLPLAPSAMHKWKSLTKLLRSSYHYLSMIRLWTEKLFAGPNPEVQNWCCLHTIQTRRNSIYLHALTWILTICTVEKCCLGDLPTGEQRTFLPASIEI